MNWNRVTVVTKPSVLPVTLDQVKDRLRIDTDADDALLIGLIKGAIARIDGPAGIGYALMEQTWRLSLDEFPGNYNGTIVLPGAPVKSVTSVNYVDSAGANQTVATADWRLDIRTEPVRLEPEYGTAWPGTRDINGAVWVDYVLGEANAEDVPDDLTDAICLLVGHRYENREVGVTGTIFTKLPLGAEWIMQEYRRNVVTA